MAVDLFDQLGENAWTLPTADEMATLRVTELGEGPLIVTLHGGPGAHYGYLVDAVRDSLSRARFVLFDQPGAFCRRSLTRRSNGLRWISSPMT